MTEQEIQKLSEQEQKNMEETECPDCHSWDVETFFDGEGTSCRCRECEHEWILKGE